MKDYLIIGKIGGAHGVRGEVRIIPLTDDVRRFSSLKECLILDGKEHLKETKEVEKARVDDTRTLVKFKGIDDRDEVGKLTGFFLAVSREDAVKLPEGRYFIADLIGLSVVDPERGELGKIKDIMNSGASDIIIVKRKGKNELLIPYLNAIVKNVDLSAGVMSVTLPEGLYEIYE
ncbi:MAG TPA: 16S rRNA processing protein RimM [Clostridiales bacterium]|nr:16S rRNA processing protein RimM [Clostridiales bacterium]